MWQCHMDSHCETHPGELAFQCRQCNKGSIEKIDLLRKLCIPCRCVMCATIVSSYDNAHKGTATLVAKNLLGSTYYLKTMSVGHMKGLKMTNSRLVHEDSKLSVATNN